jgi:hypothetical protein
MRSVFALISTLLLLTTASAAAPWVTFNDPLGRYTVMFPVTPTSVTTSIKAPNGIDLPLIQYIEESPDRQVALILADMSFAGLNINPQAGFDAVESRLNNDKYTLVSSGPDTLDGQTGITFVVLDHDGTRLSDRMFIVGDHVYEVVSATSSTATADDTADAQRFVQSLHFTQAISRLDAPAGIVPTGVVDTSCLASADQGTTRVAQQGLAQASRPAALALQTACTVLQAAPHEPAH